MLFGDWLCYWYETHSKPTLRASTRNNYENVIHNHVLPEIGKISLHKLSQNDLQQFYGRLKKNGRKRLTEQYGAGLSDRMVRMCHAVCRSALERAVRDDLLRTNPAIGCKLPPKKAKEMQVLDREELQKFLIQAQADGYYELFLLDICTGLRRGELIALQWEDLNFETGVLTVNKQAYTVNGELQIIPPKTKASVRKLVLPPAVLAVLREYRRKVDSRWMFPSPVKADRPITPGVARRRLQTILERAECKRVRFHDLRHTFATLALENGCRTVAFPSISTGVYHYPLMQAAHVALKAMTDFLRDHPGMHLRMICHNPNALRAYQVDWNMFYQDVKPHA
mgnify:CR=1 FL=1